MKIAQWLAVGLLGVVATTALADIAIPGQPRPRPRPVPNPAPKFEIEVDVDLKEPVLSIPAGVLMPGGNRPGGIPGAAPGAAPGGIGAPPGGGALPGGPASQPPLGRPQVGQPKERVGDADPEAVHDPMAQLDDESRAAVLAAIDESLDAATMTESQTPKSARLFAGVALALAAVSAGFWVVRRNRGASTTLPAIALSMTLLGGAVVWANVPPPPNPPRVTLANSTVRVTIVPRGDTIKLSIPPAVLRDMMKNAPARLRG
ncbi:hypothetical protein [Tuwongella immobilis]|uniref:Uncharacterized protein n=1 Tax=Tuwongella immobilis TaxID=692036 RepID=A0A6C2YGN3_9BACT|nr:hypothetical protein [Tuwongella immobilis]VIP00680.1 unnamed protein product [Tuwongella immobilis]VTR96778.1 unnamed protein product [Tuwongella immobilis]